MNVYLRQWPHANLVKVWWKVKCLQLFKYGEFFKYFENDMFDSFCNFEKPTTANKIKQNTKKPCFFVFNIAYV